MVLYHTLEWHNITDSDEDSDISDSDHQPNSPHPITANPTCVKSRLQRHYGTCNSSSAAATIPQMGLHNNNNARSSSGNGVRGLHGMNGSGLQY